MSDIQSRRVSVCSIKGLDCPHSLIQGAKPSYSMATRGLLGLQFGISENKGCVCEKERAHGSDLHGSISWLCRCEGKGTKWFLRRNSSYSLPSFSPGEKKDKGITTPSHSPACTCFSECRCALLYLRAIHTITIPMTLKESSVVEWHFLPLKTFGQRPEF